MRILTSFMAIIPSKHCNNLFKTRLHVWQHDGRKMQNYHSNGKLSQNKKTHHWKTEIPFLLFDKIYSMNWSLCSVALCCSNSKKTCFQHFQQNTFRTHINLWNHAIIVVSCKATLSWAMNELLNRVLCAFFSARCSSSSWPWLLNGTHSRRIFAALKFSNKR